LRQKRIVGDGATRLGGVPLLSLNQVADFSTQNVRSVADLQRAMVEKEEVK
jgi:hypothetical protein